MLLFDSLVAYSSRFSWQYFSSFRRFLAASECTLVRICTTQTQSASSISQSHSHELCIVGGLHIERHTDDHSMPIVPAGRMPLRKLHR